MGCADTTIRWSRAAALALMALGLAAGADSVRASSVTSLEGSWTVAEASMNGKPRGDGKVLNATWRFRGTELVVQSMTGERLRAALSFDATAEPPAFHVTPLDPPGERARWMIWARQGDELRVAFYDGVDGRPEDFGPRRKLVVLTLVPTPTAPPVALDPCHVLRTAGVERLLGGPMRARPAPRNRSAGSSCALERTDGSSAISLTLVGAPAGPGYVDAARRETVGDSRMQIEEEPSLGAGAFSGARGWTMFVIAHRRGTGMILTVEAPGGERSALRRFAARVLDTL